MTYNIAVAGKGGVGKTSLTGLLIDTLVKQKKDPILVVDADANCNLYEHLFAVHRLDVGNHHFAHNRLNIVDIPLPIIAERIRG